MGISTHYAFKRLFATVFCIIGIAGQAQTTVTYNMGNTGYFTSVASGTSGTYQANSNTELGQYAHGGGTKSIVSFRDFKTAGDNTGSTRALQVGDVFSVQVYASSAFGSIGFSLNTANVTTSYATRNSNSRLYVQVDGNANSWYVNSSAGNQTLDYNVSNSTYRDYRFKVYITSETTCDVELIVGATTKRLFNLTMNGAAGTNITGFSLYMADDWNGSANADIFWKQVTEVRSNTLVNLGYYLTSGNFVPGKIKDGLTAGSTSTASVNAVNIGGDSGSTVILNQANTYTGATTVNALARGELQNAQGLGLTSGTTINSNGAISLYSPTGITYNNYPLTINGNGQNGSNGALRNVGGNNTWSGSVTSASSSKINADISGSLILSGNISLPSSGHNLEFGGTQPITIYGNVSGSGSISKTGSNTLNLMSGIFNNSNTLAGNLSISEGTVAFDTGASLGQGIISFPSSASVATLKATQFATIDNTISSNASKATLDVDLYSVTCSGTVAGSGRINKAGAGTLQLTSINNSFNGLNIGNGTVKITNSANLGTGTVILGLDANNLVQANHVTLDLAGATIVNNSIVVSPNLGMSRTISSLFSSNTINGAVTLNGDLTTIASGGMFTYNGVLSGTGGLYCIGSGPVVLTAANTYLGDTYVSGGLRLGNSNVIPNNSKLVLDGATFQTNGYSNTVSVLSLLQDSTIALAAGSHQITFANSSAQTWSGSLTITGWGGTAGQSNASGGRIMVGVGGLSAQQLAVITFQGYAGKAMILPSGELVPQPGPDLAVVFGDTNNGDSCVGSAAETITYVINNAGGDADGISVVSDNAEFVVSNLSANSIAYGQNATYDVTFTPSASGTRTANITINTTTANSNAPIVSVVTGNGIAPTTYYADADSDGFGDAAVTALACNGAPAGYVANDDDCNDALTVYQDNDADGFGSLVKVACDGVANHDDCDDNTVRYADNDNDGYGSLVKVACGGSTNNTDCDDTKPTVHPGAVEIGYNLIDDDCDGQIDEGFPPKVTEITGVQCNTALAAIDSQLYADIVAGAQGYQWRITTMSGPNTGQVQFLNTTLRVMKLTQLASYAYNTAYKVEVAVYFTGYLQPYTTSNCTVTTPAITTSLISCGQTLSTMSDVIYANNVLAAAGYRFRITDGTSTQAIDRSVREFRMNLITAFQVKFNKTYSVEVAVKNTDGTYLPYGAPCLVNTPVFPTTSVQDSQCEDYAAAAMNTQIYANSYPGAIAYGFNLSGNNFGAEGVEVIKTTRAFKLGDFTGLLPGATYSVRVRLIFNYGDPAGSYGKTCTVTVPGAARMAKLPFGAKAYPNPFADSFSIDVSASLHETIAVKVYDMTGRLLESKTAVSQEMETLTIGDRFPSGVYNVVVSQGDEVKTLRVVKR